MLKTPLVALLLSSSLGLPASAAEQLDLSRVTDVRITGSAGSTVLTAATASPYSAEVTAVRSGWVGRLLSIWPSEACDRASTMTLDGTTLTVVVISGEMSSCHVTVTANLPEGVSISIEQPAAEVSLSGSYREIRLKSAASDFRFEGSAKGIFADCDALKAGIAFAAIHDDETVDLRSTFLSADMSFADAKAISYRIDAGASLVNSRYDNTPGARPAVLIQANSAKISLQ